MRGRTTHLLIVALIILSRPARLSADDFREALDVLAQKSIPGQEERKDAAQRAALRVLVAADPYRGMVTEGVFSASRPDAHYTVGLRVAPWSGMVVALREDDAAYRHGLRLGDTLLAVDGVPYTRLLLSGALCHDLGFGLAMSEAREIKLAAIQRNGMLMSVLATTRPSEHAWDPQSLEVHQVSFAKYVRVRDLYSRGSGAQLGSILSGEALPLILDLRQCTTSRLDEVVEVAEHLAPSNTTVAAICSGQEVAFRKTVIDRRASGRWQGHVILLVSEFTAGDEEVLIPFLRRFAQAEVVGTRSAGRASKNGMYALPSGASLIMASNSVRDCNGECKFGIGYEPDHVVGCETREMFPDIGIDEDGAIRMALSLYK